MVDGGTQFFLLDRSKSRASLLASLRPRLVQRLSDVAATIDQANRHSLWLSYESDLTDALVKAIPQSSPALGSAIFLHPLHLKAIPTLSSVFRRIAFSVDGSFLPADELAEVLEAESPANYFLGGFVDETTKLITFWRGDLDSLTVPFTAFARSGDGTVPDFSRLQVADCGQTVSFGDYEAAVDAILYEHDPLYRRALAKRRKKEERSFGASLRRIRKQRGLRREDFQPEISAKTIARIEQGLVKRIQRKTLLGLAEKLAVEPDEIASF